MGRCAGQAVGPSLPSHTARGSEGRMFPRDGFALVVLSAVTQHRLRHSAVSSGTWTGSGLGMDFPGSLSIAEIQLWKQVHKASLHPAGAQ